jgi:hypothetical protein
MLAELLASERDLSKVGSNVFIPNKNDAATKMAARNVL